MRKKRKYNPNKRTPAQVQYLQRQAAIRRAMTQMQEVEQQKFEQIQQDGLVLEMEYVAHHARQYIDQKKIEEPELFNGLIAEKSTTEIVPYHVGLGSYGWQDLAIPLILDQIKECEWYIAVNIHLMDIHSDSSEMITVSYEQVVPEMHHIEVWQGKADAKVDLGAGLKRVGWKGLRQELSDAIDARGDIPENYSIEYMQIFVRAAVKFKTLDLYREFLAVREWIEQDPKIAEDRLRQLWLKEKEVEAQQAQQVAYAS